MSLITKTQNNLIGPVSFFMDKELLKLIPKVANDAIYSNEANWYRVSFVFKHNNSRKRFVPSFKNFSSTKSLKIRSGMNPGDYFELKKIIISKSDRSHLVIKENEIPNVINFDFGLMLAAPSSLSYASPVSYTVGAAIANNSPTVTGAVASYSISPSLPAGLSFNTTTGVISGTPSVASGASNYTVTATNSGGSTTSVLSVAVVSAIAAPSSLSYYREIEDFMMEEPIKEPMSDITLFKNSGYSLLLAQVTGSVTSYSVSPSLPTGLSLDTTTGTISGTATVSQGKINYTVTATNEGGSTSTILKINVNDPYVNLTFANAVVHNSTYVGKITNTGWIERLLPSTDLGSNKNASSWYTTPLTGDFLFTASFRTGSQFVNGVTDGNTAKAIIGLNDTLSFTSPYSVKDVGWGIEFEGSTLQAKPWGINDVPFSYGLGQVVYLRIERISGVITFKLHNMDPDLNPGNPNMVTSQWTHSITNSSTLYIVNHFQRGGVRLTFPKLSLN